MGSFSIMLNKAVVYHPGHWVNLIMASEATLICYQTISTSRELRHDILDLETGYGREGKKGCGKD